MAFGRWQMTVLKTLSVEQLRAIGAWHGHTRAATEIEVISFLRQALQDNLDYVRTELEGRPRVQVKIRRA